jgi:putative DNA primase/helicase
VSLLEMELARAYATIGWLVFPLHPITPAGRCAGCGGVQCAGKHPIPRGWQNTIASVSAAESAWREQLGDRGLGLVCGPRSGVFGLDADRRHGAELTLSGWRGQGRRSDTVIDETGDGWHFFYRWPEGFEVEIRAQDLGGGIQCRGAGHFLVLAPSRHRSGRRYRWLRSPEDFEVAEPPEWLLELIAERSKRKAKLIVPGNDDYLIPGGQRYTHMTRFAGLLRSAGVNQTTFVQCGMAFVRHQCEAEPPMDFEYAEAQLRKMHAAWAGAYTPREKR